MIQDREEQVLSFDFEKWILVLFVSSLCVGGTLVWVQDVQEIDLQTYPSSLNAHSLRGRVVLDRFQPKMGDIGHTDETEDALHLGTSQQDEAMEDNLITALITEAMNTELTGMIDYSGIHTEEHKIPFLSRAFKSQPMKSVARQQSSFGSSMTSYNDHGPVDMQITALMTEGMADE